MIIFYIVLLNALQTNTDCTNGLEICVFLTRITGYFFLFDNIVLMLYYIMLCYFIMYYISCYILVHFFT